LLVEEIFLEIEEELKNHILKLEEGLFGTGERNCITHWSNNDRKLLQEINGVVPCLHEKASRTWSEATRMNFFSTSQRF
jgi:hypothetical protein